MRVGIESEVANENNIVEGNCLAEVRQLSLDDFRAGKLQ